MKQLHYIALAFAFLVPTLVFGATAVPWIQTNLTDGFVKPAPVNGTANGIIVSASSTIVGALNVTDVITSTATAPNTLPYASSTAITVSGNAYFPSTSIWQSDGHIGIGTTSPNNVNSLARNLVIDGGGNTGLSLIATGAAGSNSTIAFGKDAGFIQGRILYSHTSSGVGGADAMSFYTAASAQPRMILDGSGNVGIGTTTPTLQLSLMANSSSVTNSLDQIPGIQIENVNQQNNNFAGLLFRGIDGAGSEFTGSKVAGVFTDHTAGAASGAMAFLTRNAGTLTEKMRIDSSGNVGIGTTTPNSLLQLEGSAFSATGNGIFNISTGGSTGNDRGLSFGYDSTNNWSWIYSRDVGVTSKGLALATQNSGGVSMLINSSGNVGIGTTTPVFKLQVTADATNAANMTSGQMAISGTTDPTKRLILGYDTTSNYGFIKPGRVGIAFDNLVLNPSGGNVGIGTTTPSSLFSVHGDSYNSGAAFFGGAITATSTLALGGALTYGGVTLSNAVTGTGNMVLSASPAFSGTVTAPIIRGGTGVAGLITLRGSTNASPTSASGVLYQYGASGIAGESARMQGDNGLWGFGSTTPYAQLSIHANPNNYPFPASNILFAIGSSTVSATTTLFSISNTGAITASSTLTLSALATPAGSILAVDATGKIIATTTSAGGVSSVTGTYPVQSSGGATPAISLAFGTTTTNIWSNLQTYSAGFLSLASSTIGNGTQAGGLFISGGATTTGKAVFNDQISDTNVYTGVVSPIRRISLQTGTTTAWTASTSGAYIPRAIIPFAGTVRNVLCETDAGTLNIDFYHTSTHLALLNASTTKGTFNFASNNTVTAGETLYMAAGTPASSPTTVSCTIGLTETPA